jgi:DNA invertase Pin-like site-specific DNA recombinase
MNTFPQVRGGERLRAYGYERVSKVGARGDDLISPELQAYSIDTWAARNNVEIVEHIQDLDETGREFEKRKVKEMIAGIKRGDADMVVLWKWSRWGRNLLQSRIYIAAVEEAGGQVRASEEDFDPTTTMGKFTRDQMLMIAELQSNQISDGWKEAQAKRRRDGLPHTSAPRYGYTYTRGDGYVIDEGKRDILIDLYGRFTRGETMASLTRSMNARGQFTLSGEPWTPTSLGRMLDTGFAAGLIRERSNPPKAKNNKQSIKHFDIWRKGAHEPIVPEQLWELYKGLRLANSRRPRRVVAAKHPLSGLMVCAECGGGMVSVYSSKNRKHTWTCGARQRRHVKGLPCHAPVTLSNLRALTAVREWVDRNLEGGDQIESLISEATRRRGRPTTNLQNLEDRVASIEAEQVELARQLMKKRISEAAYDVLKPEVDDRWAQANAALEAARAEPRESEAPTRAVWEGVSRLLDQATPEDLRKVLPSVVGSVLVRPGPFDDRKVLVVPAWELA